jgi:hypothetical protein
MVLPYAPIIPYRNGESQMAKSKQCTVVIRGKRCTNKRKEGSRSCGCHGKRRAASSSGRRSRRIHLDARLPTIPEKTYRVIHVDYQYPTVIIDPARGMLRVSLLPTNEAELSEFIAQWLCKYGHTLEDVYRIAPRKLSIFPDDYGLTALALLENDTPPPAGYRMALAGTAMVATAVPV